MTPQERSERPTQYEVAVLSIDGSILVAGTPGGIVTADGVDEMQRLVTDSHYRGPFSWWPVHRDLSPRAWPTAWEVLRAWAMPQTDMLTSALISTAWLALPPASATWEPLRALLDAHAAYEAVQREARAWWFSECARRGEDPYRRGPPTSDTSMALLRVRGLALDALASAVVAHGAAMAPWEDAGV
jgi:hypothetical protein